ncbi:MAG: pyrroloquinoline quinone-dependent dehydrogenase [Bacteroidia bacterium]|nr:pyrroloquinoline quinone-dependent dehydrogenase [Bacteroidia bacterium]NND12022.1 pyrroloquinoline quinone-dependent dehydrogenase [Flavobacteriaceae bacterium]
MKSNFLLSGIVVLLICSFISCSDDQNSKKHTSWKSYLGGDDRNHFTHLNQITPENVNQLEVAWSYKTIDSGQMQMSPIIANGMVYGVDSRVQPFALDAKTGSEIWRFGDPLKAWHSTSRGVSYWEKGNDKRIFCSIGPDLYALNALTGMPIETFGDKGRISLKKGLPEIAQDKFMISNTPGTIFKDLIIMPVRASEGADAAPGDVRAFNVITGELEWTFHTIPHPGEFGYDTWEIPDTYKNTENVGAVNNWAGMAVDMDREILYVPLGSAAPDFYGGERKGQNLFANSLVALDANTGERIWHFQMTHHDIWDRDLPAPPNLIWVQRNGQRIDAVAQVTKQGYVFVFDRETGEPIFEIEEVPVPSSTLAGESAWPTQPLPVKPKPFARQSEDLTETDISPYAENKAELRAKLKQHDKAKYAPPSTEPVLLFPGYDGGAEWGGAGADPEQGILYVNSNEMPWILQVSATNTKSHTSVRQALYDNHCAVCHKPDRSGAPQSNFPALTNLDDHLLRSDARDIIINGKGMMTGFPQLRDAEVEALLAYIYDDQEGDKQEVSNVEEIDYQVPFKHTGYDKFLDSNGLPAITPPWGTLSAIDLNNGEYLWQTPLGKTKIDDEYVNTGTENYGGPIITENGLLFIAATKDGYFRAFDRHDGNLLWETKLPAASFTTPATYMIDGKQYIVLACGGEKLGTPKGNVIMAFALPIK